MRVLNLWQKNAVFKSDIIQPLLDMAAGIPPPSVTPVMPGSTAPVNNTTPGQSTQIMENTLIPLQNPLLSFSNITPLCVSAGTPATPATPANIVQGLPDWASQINNTDTVAAVAQILQSPQGQQVNTEMIKTKHFKLQLINPKKAYISKHNGCAAVGVITKNSVISPSCSSWCRVYSCSSRSRSRPCCKRWMLAWWCSCKR